jgi:hypothetical protein
MVEQRAQIVDEVADQRSQDEIGLDDWPDAPPNVPLRLRVELADVGYGVAMPLQITPQLFVQKFKVLMSAR